MQRVLTKSGIRGDRKFEVPYVYFEKFIGTSVSESEFHSLLVKKRRTTLFVPPTITVVRLGREVEGRTG